MESQDISAYFGIVCVLLSLNLLELKNRHYFLTNQPAYKWEGMRLCWGVDLKSWFWYALCASTIHSDSFWLTIIKVLSKIYKFLQVNLNLEPQSVKFSHTTGIILWWSGRLLQLCQPSDKGKKNLPHKALQPSANILS